MSERIRFYDDRVRGVRRAAERRARCGLARRRHLAWREVLYIGLLVDYKRPELAETFFNSVVTRVMRRTYVHNDFAFVRAAVSTEYIESDPPIYRSYYPAEVGLRTSLLEIFADFGWKRPFADLERDVGFVWQALLRALRRRVAAARAELPGAGARLRLLPQQGRLRDREDRQRQRGDTVRRRRAPRRGRPARARHGALRPREHLGVVRALAGLLHGRHGRSVGLRPVPADADAREAALRPLHGGRAREAGQDALHPRPAPPPAPLAGRLRRGPRHARPRDARVHAAVVPVRVQGDQGRVRPLEGLRPRDGEAQVPDGQGDRPRRADGGHARVQRTSPSRATASRPSCSTSCSSWRRRRSRSTATTSSSATATSSAG